jgi:hypothetical protein
MSSQWYEPKRRQEYGVWVLLDNQIERSKEPFFNLKTLELETNNNRGWIINTKHGPVLVETWKRPDSPIFVEYHVWFGEYRYWHRKYDKYKDDNERINSAHDFAQIVIKEIKKVEKS